MYRLFEFFYQYRAFLFFVLLETICIWLIVNYNHYQGAAFFNSSNRYVGSILEVKTNIQDYFQLKQVNEELAEENARLKQKLNVKEQEKDFNIPNNSDFLRANRYEFIAAKVINNSTGHFNNYITLDKGKLDGIKEGMGIISSQGIVGQINKCSDHYCTGFSILNRNLNISAIVKTKGFNCIVKWNGNDPDPSIAELTSITRNQKIAVGDTIVTSGFNTFFPRGIIIGKIKEFTLEGGSFWNAKISLSTDFQSLSYVYVIGNKLKVEQDSLEFKNKLEEEGRHAK